MGPSAVRMRSVLSSSSVFSSALMLPRVSASSSRVARAVWLRWEEKHSSSDMPD